MCYIPNSVFSLFLGKFVSAFLTISLFLICLFLMLQFANTSQKYALLKLTYNWRNMHLFTRAITTANIITTVAIAFLIAIKPTIYSYMSWPTTNDFGSFLLDISFAWIGCSASAEKYC